MWLTTPSGRGAGLHYRGVGPLPRGGQDRRGRGQLGQGRGHTGAQQGRLLRGRAIGALLGRTEGSGITVLGMENINKIYPNNSRDVYFYIYWVSAYMG